MRREASGWLGQWWRNARAGDMPLPRRLGVITRNELRRLLPPPPRACCGNDGEPGC